MSIEPNSVVTLHYTLKDQAGEVLETSASGAPLAYLHGHGQLIPGLERELDGRGVGDKLNVRVPAAQGYGEYDAELVEEVPRRVLKGISGIEVGMKLRADTEAGPRTVTITRIVGDLVTLDGNHPLAGQDLEFDVEITDVRAATEEELAHGHVHGTGGEHH